MGCSSDTTREMIGRSWSARPSPWPNCKPKAAQLVGKAEILRFRPDRRHLVGRHARLDQRDRGVQPFAALDVRVALRRRGAADVEGAVVAGAIALVALQDVEERLIAGAEKAIGEVVRMRAAALAGDGVDRLDVVRAHFVEHLVRHRDDVVLANARLQLLPDHVIDAVHHAGRLVEQLDLVDVLDLARRQHDLLAVDDLEPRLLQGREHRRFRIVHAHGHVGHAGLFQEAVDFLGIALHQPERGRDGAAHADDAGQAAFGVEPVAIFPVMNGGRAEIPHEGLFVAGEQSETAHLVPFPLADLGAGDVADIVDVEQQQRAALGTLQRGLGAAKAVAAQPIVIDAAFEIDGGVAERGDVPVPAPVRVDVARSQDAGTESGVRSHHVHESLLRARRAPELSIAFRKGRAGALGSAASPCGRRS